MRKMFLVFGIMLLVVTTQASVYAIEMSIGASVGASLGIEGDLVIRGKNAFDEQFYFTVFPTAQLDIMFEFLPFLALETGVGYSYYKISNYDINGSFPDEGIIVEVRKGNTVFLKHGFTIPIMLRGQYEFKRVLLYGSVGPKLFIPIADYVDETDSTLPAGFFESNDLVLDLGFALGVEFRIGDANYLGLRASYDLNLISPLKSVGGKTDHNFNNDNVGVRLTYRYAFGSKWKNK